MIQLKFDIDPVAKARPRLGKYGNTYTPAKTAQFENLIGYMARVQLRQLNAMAPLAGALKLKLRFFIMPPKRQARNFPTVKPDWDNFSKSLCDALNGIVWFDDAQIVKAEVEKLYDWTTKKGRIELVVEEIT